MSAGRHDHEHDLATLTALDVNPSGAAELSSEVCAADLQSDSQLGRDRFGTLAKAALRVSCA